MITTVAIKTVKRYVALALVTMILMLGALPLGSVVSANPAAAAAQTRRYRVRRKRSFWKKHRDKLTVVGSGLGGAAIGGLAGGKKGALIGTAVGAGSGAVYTYKIRKRHRRRY